MESQGPMDFEDALTPGDIYGCYLGFVDRWTIVFDYGGYLNANGITRTEHELLITPESPLGRLSRDSTAFSFFLEGYAEIVAFSWYENGRIVRSLYIEGSTVKLDFGTPLPQEFSAFELAPDNEQAVLSLMESLTLTIEQISPIPYEYYLPAER